MTGTARALGRELATAIRALTVLPLPVRPMPGGTAIARATVFFPAVGALLGGLLAAADRATAPVVPVGIRSVLLVALLEIACGGRHLAALAAAARSLAAPSPSERRDGARWPSGVVAAVVVLAKVLALAEISGPLRTSALLVAPLLARWAPVVLAYGGRPVRSGESRAALGIGRVAFREFGWASVIGLGSALAVGEALGLVAATAAAGLATGLRLGVYRRLGGMTGDAVVASVEIVETALLLVVAAIGRLQMPPAAALATVG